MISEESVNGRLRPCVPAHEPGPCPMWHLDVLDQRPEWGVWRENIHVDEGGEGG